MTNPYYQLIIAIQTIFEPLLRWPVISLTSTSLSVFSSIIIRRITATIVNEEALDRAMKEIKIWEERRKRAIKKKDRKMYEEILRESRRIDRLRKFAFKERLKSSAISLVTWYILLRITTDIIGADKVVVIFPILGYMPLNHPAWFIIVSIFMALIYGTSTKMYSY